MAITRADLEVRRSRLLFSRSSLVVVVMLLLGLLAFGLCLIAETERTQVLWTPVSVPSLVDSDAFSDMRCSYTKSAGAALACGISALVAMLVSLSLALSKKHSSAVPVDLSLWNSSALQWQAAIFLVASWLACSPISEPDRPSSLYMLRAMQCRASFAVALALLLIGVILEAGILFQSSSRDEDTREQCLVVSQGLFTGAGIFGLASTSSMSAFYIAGLHALSVGDQQAVQDNSSVTSANSAAAALRDQALEQDNLQAEAPPAK